MILKNSSVTLPPQIEAEEEVGSGAGFDQDDPLSIFRLIVMGAMSTLEELVMPSAHLPAMKVRAYQNALDVTAHELYGKSIEDLQMDNLGELSAEQAKAIHSRVRSVYATSAVQNGTVEDSAATVIQAGWRGHQDRKKVQKMKAAHFLAGGAGVGAG
jgi:hypothetical protein